MSPTKDSGAAELPRMNLTLSFNDLTYTLPASKGQESAEAVHLLHRVSGIVRPGQILAILGASGAGKTLLLNILSGVVKRDSPNLSGSVLLNGEAPEKIQHLSRLVSHVSAVEHLTPTLTVRETFMIAADLQLPPTVSKQRKAEIVDRLIDDLGLRVAANTFVGGQFVRGCSGGQKKRVSVGCELLKAPSLLFMDTPTSGLDSAASNTVMDGIIKHARNGRHTVITSIHQPSSSLFRKFDLLMLLSHGKTVYFGPAIEALSFFAQLNLFCPESANPPDFFLQKINTDFQGATIEQVRLYVESYRQGELFQTLQAELDEIYQGKTGDKKSRAMVAVASQPQPALEAPAASDTDADASDVAATSTAASGSATESETDASKADSTAPAAVSAVVEPPDLLPTTAYAQPFYTQLWTVTARSFLNAARNPALYWVRVAMFVLLCVVLGSMYGKLGNSEQDVYRRMALIFFVVAFFTFLTCAALPELMVDRAIFQNERRNGAYSVPVYLLASTLSSLPWIVLIAIISSSILYFWVNLNNAGGSGHFWIFFVLLFLALVVAESLVVFVSTLTKIFLVGLAAVAGSMALCMLSAGFFIRISDMPNYLRWLNYFSFQKYSFRSMVYNEFHSVTFTCQDGQTLPQLCAMSPSGTSFSGDAVLSIYGFQDNYIGPDIGVLVAMAVGFRILTLISLYLQRGQRK